MNKRAMAFAFLFLFVGFLGMTAQLKDHEMIRLEKEAMRIQAEAVASGYVIYVNAGTGDDVKGEGTAKKPYLTISKALRVANSGDTINIGPGVYNESLYIDRLDRIILEGSGSGSCILGGYLYTIWCKYLAIKGLKITGAEGTGLWCDNTDVAVVEDCNFEVLEANGIVIEHNSAMWVYNSQLNCGPDGVGAVSHSFSYLWLQNCTVTGNAWGIQANRGALMYLTNCTISNNQIQGVWIDQNAEFYMDGVSIFGNQIGLQVLNGGVVNCSNNINKIYGNTESGIHLGIGGTAELRNTEIYNNPTGIRVVEAGILCLRGSNNYVHNNDVGIEVREFGHAFLRQTSINGNGLDVSIHTGGQATCDPSKIGTLSSDCPYCQK